MGSGDTLSSKQTPGAKEILFAQLGISALSLLSFNKNMNPTILGISGSPVKGSNTDRAVKFILEATGLDSEFIKLSDYDIQPCRACLGCKESNRCVVQDDAPELAEKFRRAKAFVIGGFTPYSSLDARTKSFMERMYCLRHQTGHNRGKIGVSVITTACPPNTPGMPPAYETALAQISFWMLEEGMKNLGSLLLLGNVPCIKCGHGDECELSGVKMLFGPEATVASVGVHTFEGDVTLLSNARDLAKGIRDEIFSSVTQESGSRIEKSNDADAEA